MHITDFEKDKLYSKQVMALLFCVGGRPWLWSKNDNYWNTIGLVYYPSGTKLLEMVKSQRMSEIGHLKKESLTDTYLGASKPLYCVVPH